MRRVLVGLAGLGMTLLILSGCAGKGLTSRVSESTSTFQIGPPGQGTATANRAAARRDAAALLKRLRLPSGAVASVTEPRGDHGYLKLSANIEGDRANALRHAWWTSGEPVSAVLTYLKSHAPAGSTQDGSGSTSDTHTGTSSTIVDFEWPSGTNVLGSRELQVTVTALPGGTTGILAEAQSDWVVPRSRSERVPAGATTVRITLQRRTIPVSTGRPKTVLQAVLRKPRAVAHAIRLIDSLAVVQPVAIMCPLVLLTGQSLTVSYSAGPAGPALAQARVSLQAPSSGGANSCDPILFSIRGRAQTSLLGASFVKQIEQLAGFPS